MDLLPIQLPQRGIPLWRFLCMRESTDYFFFTRPLIEHGDFRFDTVTFVRDSGEPVPQLTRRSQETLDEIDESDARLQIRQQDGRQQISSCLPSDDGQHFVLMKKAGEPNTEHPLTRRQRVVAKGAIRWNSENGGGGIPFLVVSLPLAFQAELPVQGDHTRGRLTAIPG